MLESWETVKYTTSAPPFKGIMVYWKGQTLTKLLNLQTNKGLEKPCRKYNRKPVEGTTIFTWKNSERLHEEAEIQLGSEGSIEVHCTTW